MKVLKSIHKQLCTYVTQLPTDLRSRAIHLGSATFRKTRFNSHITFIRQCLDLKIIPKGFKLTRHDSLPCHLLRKNEAALNTCSRRLMRTSLQHFSNCFNSASKDLIEAKDYLSSHLESCKYNALLLKIRTLNSVLYKTLVEVKSKKIQKLSGPSTVHENENFDDYITTIPEDLPLSLSAKKVLSKGIQFIQTPKSGIDEISLHHDMNSFYRRIALHAHFNDHERPIQSRDLEDDPFLKYKQSKSTWMPNPLPPAVSAFISRCKQDIEHVNLSTKPKSPNLNQDENDALRELKSRTDIVIKKADKGGRLVVWQKDLYLAEVNRQLSDHNFYKPSSDMTLSNNNIVETTILDEISSGNLPDSARNLILQNPRCGRFYLLPKIHKPGIPGRPIVSACSCPTEHISAYLDEVLQPLVQKLPSYVKDTTDILRKVRNLSAINSTQLLYTMDVSSLYTIIPHKDGLKAIRHFLDLRQHLYPPTNTLLRLTELVLNLNNFEANGDYYDQISGVSMGTKMGPSYACLFMGHLEDTFFSTYNGIKPSLYLRYIDDIFGIFPSDINDFNNFYAAFNDFHNSVNFTKETGQTVNFLDVKFTLNGDKIDTTIFYKPTDCHSYLRFDSFHPAKCIQSIPYSQFLRLRRICSRDEDFHTEVERMCGFFKKRGYPSQVLSSAVTKSSKSNRNTLLEYSMHNKNKVIPLVLPYHPVSLKIAGIIRKNSRVLSTDISVGYLFDNNLVTAFRNPPSIGRHLIHSRLESEEIPGTFPCERPRCKTCDHVTSINTVVGPSGSVSIYKTFTCTSKGIIYAILCTKCPQILYIGETGQMLAERFRSHLFDIRHNSNHSEVANHFNSVLHNIDDCIVTGLKYVSNREERRLKEAHLIRRLGTLIPQGLNREEDSSHR